MDFEKEAEELYDDVFNVKEVEQHLRQFAAKALREASISGRLEAAINDYTWADLCEWIMRRATEIERG